MVKVELLAFGLILVGAADSRVLHLQQNGGGSQECPADFERFEDSCYWFSKMPAVFEDAKETCESLSNAHLVVINSAEENAFVRAIASNVSFVNIGLSWDGTEDGKYVWEDGQSSFFTNWINIEEPRYANYDCTY